MTQQKTQLGISMVEILLIITFIGIITAMVFPKYGSSIDRQKNRQTPRQLQAAFGQAKHYATAYDRDIEVNLNFSVTPPSISIVDPSPIEGGGEKTISTYEIDVISAPTSNSKIQKIIFSKHQKSTFYDSSDAQIAAEAAIISLTTQSGGQTNITIYAESGTSQIGVTHE